MEMDTLIFPVLLALVLVAGWWDLRYRRVPNALTVTGLLIALALRGVAGWEPFASGLAGFGLAFLLGLPLFLLGGMGGGDVKLLAAVGAFLGFGNLLPALLVTGVAGALLALGMALWKGRLGETLANTTGLVRRLLTSAGGAVGLGASRETPARTLATPGALTIPYAIPIGIGAVAGWLL